MTIAHIEAGFQQLETEERALRHYFAGDREGGDDEPPAGAARRDRHGQRRPKKHRFYSCLQVRHMKRRGRVGTDGLEAGAEDAEGDAEGEERDKWSGDAVVADSTGNGLDTGAIVGNISRVNEKAKKRIYDTVLRRSHAFKGLVAEAVGEGRSGMGYTHPGDPGNLLPGGAYPPESAMPRSPSLGDAESDDQSIDEAFVLEILKGDPAGGELFARGAPQSAGGTRPGGGRLSSQRFNKANVSGTAAARGTPSRRSPRRAGGDGSGEMSPPPETDGQARPATAGDAHAGQWDGQDVSRGHAVLRPGAAATQRFRAKNPGSAPYVRKLFHKIEHAKEMKVAARTVREEAKKQVVTCLRGRPIVPPVVTREQLATYKFHNRKALRVEKPTASAVQLKEERKGPVPRSLLLHRKEYYYIHIRILIHDASLLRWRFRVTFTDITVPDCPQTASFAPLRADEHAYIIFEEPNNCIFSPVDHLEWAKVPYDLYGHTLRVEVVGIQPMHTRVVDSLIYFGETPPGEAAVAS